jgi:hypothetical protein
MYTKIRKKLLCYLINFKYVRSEISTCNAQVITLWYRSTSWLAGLNLNIPGYTRECFWLIEFWASLYFWEFYLLGYKTVQSEESQPTFRKNMSLLSSNSKSKPSKTPAWGSACCLLHAVILLCLLLDPEDGNEMFLRNIGWLCRTAWCYIQVDRTLHIHRCNSLKCYIIYYIRLVISCRDSNRVSPE